MQPIENLRADHELIEQVLGSLRAFVAARDPTPKPPP
jgi:hypothetical protein